MSTSGRRFESGSSPMVTVLLAACAGPRSAAPRPIARLGAACKAARPLPAPAPEPGPIDRGIWWRACRDRGAPRTAPRPLGVPFTAGTMPCPRRARACASAASKARPDLADALDIIFPQILERHRSSFSRRSVRDVALAPVQPRHRLRAAAYAAFQLVAPASARSAGIPSSSPCHFTAPSPSALTCALRFRYPRPPSGGSSRSRHPGDIEVMGDLATFRGAASPSRWRRSCSLALRRLEEQLLLGRGRAHLHHARERRIYSGSRRGSTIS